MYLPFCYFEWQCSQYLELNPICELANIAARNSMVVLIKSFPKASNEDMCRLTM